MVKKKSILFILVFFLGACASRMKNQLLEYRAAYAVQDYERAGQILNESALKEDKKSLLLWHLEKGTVAHAMGNEDSAINHFQISLDLIDKLFTTKLSSKAASFLINDASDDFYGASYERSYAHYFLAKCLYSRFQKTGDKASLQGARAAILAWDSYFVELQRSATSKTLYTTDLMLKIFGGQIHEVSEIRNDLQIALQLYKDAYQILLTQGGIFSIFNKKNLDYIKHFEKEGTASNSLYEETPALVDLKQFLHYKILSLTKEIRTNDFDHQVKSLGVKPEVKSLALQGSGNVVVVLEEGLIPQKVGRPFNFGLKGAVSAVDNPAAKTFIATVGAEVLTSFAMNKLGMIPEKTASAGSFIFAHDMTRLAVQEAAVEFELPMIKNVHPLQRLELFVMNDQGVVLKHLPIPVVSENGDIARVVLEEDVVARYIKTGTRIATRHILAIVTAMKVYQTINSKSGDFLAKTAAMGTYVAAAKGIAALEKADTRHWTTLPQALRIAEISLKSGAYKLGVGAYSGNKSPDAPTKILGDFQVKDSGKSIFTFRHSH
jgi:hypothetical protein